MSSYALNPIWYYIEQTKKSPSSDREVMKGFMRATRRIYGPYSEEASLIRTQFAQCCVGLVSLAQLRICVIGVTMKI